MDKNAAVSVNVDQALMFGEESLDQLLQPNAYRHPVSEIILRETHISWLLLTGAFVYKIKRPVNFGFLDFSTLEKRRFFCEEEVRLNRRFAPDIYIGVVPITQDDDKISVEGSGKVIEYAVKMRQFDECNLLQNIAAEGRFTHTLAQLLGRHIAQVHQRLPCHHASLDDREETVGTPSSIFSAMEQNFSQIRPYIRNMNQLSQLSKIETWYRQRREVLEPFLWRRLDEGFVRECHGDLHLGNITLIDGQVTLFDCIEFNREFRLVDVLCELATLEMDLDNYDLQEQANTVLNAYLEVSGDYPGLRELNFFRVYAAMVRAKVALLKTNTDTKSTENLPEDYHRYIGLAERYTLPVDRKPHLILTCGVSGSGKSTVGAYLAGYLGGVRVRSDVERKRLLGSAPNPFRHSVQPSGEPYSSTVTQQTYLRLEKLAPLIIGSGFSSIVDATFNSRIRRSAFLQVAEQLEVTPVIVYCHAGIPELERRIRLRSAKGEDASEATVDVLHQQLKHFEFPDSNEGFIYVSVDTERNDWRRRLANVFDELSIAEMICNDSL